MNIARSVLFGIASVVLFFPAEAQLGGGASTMKKVPLLEDSSTETKEEPKPKVGPKTSLKPTTKSAAKPSTKRVVKPAIALPLDKLSRVFLDLIAQSKYDEALGAVRDNYGFDRGIEHELTMVEDREAFRVKREGGEHGLGRMMTAGGWGDPIRVTVFKGYIDATATRLRVGTPEGLAAFIKFISSIRHEFKHVAQRTRWESLASSWQMREFEAYAEELRAKKIIPPLTGIYLQSTLGKMTIKYIFMKKSEREASVNSTKWLLSIMSSISKPEWKAVLGMDKPNNAALRELIAKKALSGILGLDDLLMDKIERSIKARVGSRTKRYSYYTASDADAQRTFSAEELCERASVYFFRTF